MSDTADVAATIALNPTQWYADSLGSETQMYAGVNAENGRLLYLSSENPDLFRWTSSNTDVVGVDSGGRAIMHGWGYAIVTVTYGDGLEAEAWVTAQDAVGLSWAVPLGPGVIRSGVAVAADGTLYASSSEAALELTTLSAVRPDGEILWVTQLPIGEVSTPAIGADGTLYVGSRIGSDAPDSDGRLIAIDSGGDVVWIQDDVGRIMSSAAIGSDGTIYVSTSRGVQAFNAMGESLWTYEVGVVYSSPAVGGDGTIYVGGTDKHLHAIHPDGSRRWTYGTDGLIISPPVVGLDGTVYLGSTDGFLYAVDPGGTLRWSIPLALEGGVESSPSIGADGAIYLLAGDLFAINPDGSIRWRYPARSSGVRPTPVVGGDGTIYFGSFSGLTAVTAAGNVKWHYDTDGHLGAPAIGLDGTVFSASTAFAPGSGTGVSTMRAFAEKGSTNGGYDVAPWPTARGRRNNSGRAGGG